MSALAQLLEVQQHDTTADQLRHRRSHLPQRAAITEAQAALEASRQSLATLGMQRDVLGADQDRLESDITAARDRIKEVEGKLYGGAVSSPRELQALQDEIASLQRRISLLEDEEIGVMEQLEPLDASIAAATADSERLTADLERLALEVTVEEAEIDVALAANQAEREQSTTGVAPDLLAEYELIRGRSGGVGVASFTGGQCGGCHIRLSAMEIDRIRKEPADSIVHCEECGRLLVH